MAKQLEEMSKIELLELCKKQRFVLFKKNQEEERLRQEVEFWKQKCLKSERGADKPR